MGGKFYEKVIREFNAFIKRNTFTKEVKYRVRLLERKDHEGITRKFLDLREYIITEKKAMFTENGLYFNLEELKVLSSYITEAIRSIERGDSETV